MGDKPINLGEARALRSGSPKDWSVLDALRSAISDIESGVVDPSGIYIAMCCKDDCGCLSFPFLTAGLDRLELTGTLLHHLHERAKP